jgi:hypothetical protein
LASDIVKHFNDHEAQVIAQAPVLVFLLVSAADGTIDRYEIARFESLLISSPYSDLIAVMQRARLSIVDTLRQLTESHVDYLAELQQIARVLDRRLPPTLAQQVKNQLYDLGCCIAAASQQEQAAAGNPVSEQERVALKVIAGLIGIDENRC